MDYTQEVKDLSGDVKLITNEPAFVGPYSIVYRGRLKSSGQLVAVKRMNGIRGATVRTIRRKVQREGWAWSLLLHRNILPFYGYIEDDERFQPYGAFVSPWYRRGDLGQYLQDNPSAYLADRLKIWQGIVDGVAYLHGYSPVVIHGDLKPGNILVDDGGSAKICDFGLARVIMEEGKSGLTTTTAHTGTSRYLAYELVMEEAGIPTTSSDIYAAGCVGLEVIFQKAPYSHRINGNNLLWNIRSDMQEGRFPASRPVDSLAHSDLIWKLVSWCWAHDPVSRPRAHELSARLEEILTPVNAATYLEPISLPSTITQLQAGIQKHTPQDDVYPTPVLPGTGTASPPDENFPLFYSTHSRSHSYAPGIGTSSDAIGLSKQKAARTLLPSTPSRQAELFLAFDGHSPSDILSPPPRGSTSSAIGMRRLPQPVHRVTMPIQTNSVQLGMYYASDLTEGMQFPLPPSSPHRSSIREFSQAHGASYPVTLSRQYYPPRAQINMPDPVPIGSLPTSHWRPALNTAASPASPRTPLLGDTKFMSGGFPLPRKRRIELVKSEEVEPEGPKVHDFISHKGWRDAFLGDPGEGTLMQHQINSNPTLQRSSTDSSRSGKRNGSQSPGIPVARLPLKQPGNAPWDTYSSEEEMDSDEAYGNDPSDLWQKPLAKRISPIYEMENSLRFSTHSSTSHRGGSRSGDGTEEVSVPALPNSSENHSELLSASNSRKNTGVPMDTIDLGGTVFSFRPATEQVLEMMDNFFPDHDLDKPIMDSSINNTGTSGNNSGGSSSTMVNAPYNAFINMNLNMPEGSGANALTPTGSPILGVAALIPSPSPMGITRQKQQKTIRTLAGQGKRKMDRLSKDGAASDTMLRRRSTKFWGNSINELPPAEFEKLGADIRNTSDLPGMPEAPGGSSKPVVMQWFKGKLLGKGTYGKVYLGFNPATKEVFAVKRVQMPESRSDHQGPQQNHVLDAIKSESDTLRKLDHPNIVAYLGYEQTEKFFSIFLEYVPGGSIGECYRKLGQGFDKNLARHCTKQIVDGLAYLHSKGILHRDLKADSILVDLDGVCKISGFGNSKREHDNIYDANEVATTIQGSVFWMAPELLVPPEGYGGKVDIWSLGCVVLEMCTGERPWHPKPQLAVLLLLGSKETRQAPPLPDNLNIYPEGHDFLDECFQIEPSARPTAEALKSRPYLQKADWQFQKGAIPAH